MMYEPPLPGPEYGALRKMYRGLDGVPWCRRVMRGGCRLGRDLNGGPAENDVTRAADPASGEPPFDFGEPVFELEEPSLSIEHPLAARPAAPAADAPASPNRRLRVSSSGRCVGSSATLPLVVSGSACVGSSAARPLRSSVIGRASGSGLVRVSKPPGGPLCSK